jgi:TRAP-type uncharacterized transport system substrate-binding protein
MTCSSWSRRHLLFVCGLLASTLLGPTQASAENVQKSTSTEIPAQLPGIGIAAHKPVFGGACKSCPWGVVAEVVKSALAPYGYEVQVCYNCSLADSPRIVGDARMPPPMSNVMPGAAAGVFPPSYVPPPPNGRVEFGATSDRNLLAAYHGTGTYAQDGPRPQLRLLANIASPLYIIVAVSRGLAVSDLGQLKDHKGPLKIVVSNDLADLIFPYFGLSMDSLKAAGASFPNGNLPRDRSGAQVIIWQGNLANSPEFNIWYEESQRQDLVYLQLPEDLLTKLALALDLERHDIPVGLLRGLETPIHTVARTGTAVYGRADMPDKFAYLVAKALDEQQDLFEWALGEYSYNRYRVAKVDDVPLHPGAARYYRERGYLR